jgi:hypothetical protein
LGERSAIHIRDGAIMAKVHWTPKKNEFFPTATVPGSLQGRRVAVTGAASGIGAATARKLMADGWRVACLDRNIEGAKATAGERGIAVLIDVADEASTAAAFARVHEAFGGLGIVRLTPSSRPLASESTSLRVGQGRGQETARIRSSRASGIRRRWRH